MTAVAEAVVRGACPGALRPMESGDGLIVRVRPHLARLSACALLGLADAASRFGNGSIDLTRRANLQLRGVSRDTLEPLQAALGVLNLLDASAESEAVRNIVVSPLAGIDASERIDVLEIARGLETRLAADERLWRLPAKFGFVVDGGGMSSLAAERADVRLAAVEIDGQAQAAIGIDGPDGPCWLGAVAPRHASEAAATIALTYLALDLAGRHTMTVRPQAIIRMKSALGALLCPLSPLPVLPSSRAALGALSHIDRIFAVGLGAPFGRVDAAQLKRLAEIATSIGARDVRISPWRSFYVPVVDEAGAHIVREAAVRLGFVTDSDDPLMKIEACPGAPACRSATLETRAVARRVAALMPRLDGVGSVHVSGCAKGCACSRTASLVLTGAGDRLALIRNGRADAAPAAFIGLSDIADLPDLVRRTINHVR